MKEKTRHLVVTFHTTAAAMALEKRCAENAVSGRLAPVPRVLSSDCGIAWIGEVSQRTQTERLAEGLEVERIVEMML